MKLDFVDPICLKSANIIIDRIQNKINIKFIDNIIINNLVVKDYNSAVNTALYYGKLNYIGNNVLISQKTTNRRMATLFIMLSTYMYDRPLYVKPRII